MQEISQGSNRKMAAAGDEVWVDSKDTDSLLGLALHHCIKQVVSASVVVSPLQGSVGTLWSPPCWFRSRVGTHDITCCLPQSGLDYFVFI